MKIGFRRFDVGALDDELRRQAERQIARQMQRADGQIGACGLIGKSSGKRDNEIVLLSQRFSS